MIGAPGSEPARGFLSELATVGGSAKEGCTSADRDKLDGDCHFDMTTTDDFAKDLADALASISGKALGCEFAVPAFGTTINPNRVNVQVRAGGTDAPVCFRHDESAACDGGADGWQFSKTLSGEDDLNSVLLCGSACDMIRGDPEAQVDVILGCEILE